MTLSSSEEFQAAPISERLTGLLGRCCDGRVFVGGPPDVGGDGARVIGGWPAGAGRHVMSIADTERLDSDDFSGYDKSMTTTRETHEMTLIEIDTEIRSFGVKPQQFGAVEQLQRLRAADWTRALPLDDLYVITSNSTDALTVREALAEIERRDELEVA